MVMDILPWLESPRQRSSTLSRISFAVRVDDCANASDLKTKKKSKHIRIDRPVDRKGLIAALNPFSD